MGLLAALSLMWSILIPTKFILDVQVHSYSTLEEFQSESAKVQLAHQIEATLLAIILTFIFALNLLLAISRWTTINGISVKRQQLFDCIVLSQPILVSCISIWVFATSTSSQGVTPDLALQGLVWSAIMGTTFVTNVSGIIFFYVKTYFAAMRKLKALVAGNQAKEELLKFRVARQLSINCAILSSSLIICWLPSLVEASLRAIIGFDRVPLWLDTLSSVASTLDVIVTPILILYLKRDLRVLLFGLLKRRREELEAEAFVDDEPVILNNQANNPGFHIIRIVA
ncbi:hypothetical protein HDU98_003273 [Podochytrium sp. JEL0797]|nr:hypothetical protein HDU98_003273 [Podochytrium sp. JEL0797]